MKNLNSKWNKFLLPLVLCIWVVVGLRIFAPEKTNDKGSLEQSTAFELFDETQELSEVYVPNLQYRDPFLNSSFAKPKTQRRAPARRNIHTVAQILPAEPKVIALPPISYQGRVGPESAENFTGILSLDGKSIVVQAGAEIAGVKIMFLQAGKMTVSFQDSTYVLLRE